VFSINILTVKKRLLYTKYFCLWKFFFYSALFSTFVYFLRLLNLSMHCVNGSVKEISMFTRSVIFYKKNVNHGHSEQENSWNRVYIFIPSVQAMKSLQKCLLVALNFYLLSLYDYAQSIMES